MGNENFFELESEKYWSFPASERGQSRGEIKRMILSGAYLGARKIDGHYFRFVKGPDGTMALQTRSRGVNGRFSDKLNHVPHLRGFFDSVPCGSCLLGELYLPGKETASAVTKVIGCAAEKSARLQTNERTRLHYYVFDVWQWDGVSMLVADAEIRFRLLEDMQARFQDDCVSFARYASGRGLLDNLNEIFSSGGEGIVMTRRDSVPEPGKRTKRKTVKVKKEIRETLDAVIMGANPPVREYAGNAPESWPYWENGVAVTRNHALGLPGSLQIGAMKDGELMRIGSLGGLPDEILRNWESVVGRVCEIVCMEIHETGGLRHSRFLSWRDDLTADDCEYGKIYGNASPAAPPSPVKTGAESVIYASLKALIKECMDASLCGLYLGTAEASFQRGLITESELSDLRRTAL